MFPSSIDVFDRHGDANGAIIAAHDNVDRTPDAQLFDFIREIGHSPHRTAIRFDDDIAELVAVGTRSP
jgi:hypothetical protein